MNLHLQLKSPRAV